MLKRFFISLIILSTLTTDGIINIPGNIYNLLTCLKTQSGQLKNQELSLEESSDFQKENYFSYAAYRLSFRNMQKIRPTIFQRNLSASGLILNESNNINPKVYFYISNLYSGITLSTDGNSVFRKADSSPPISL